MTEHFCGIPEFLLEFKLSTGGTSGTCFRMCTAPGMSSLSLFASASPDKVLLVGWHLVVLRDKPLAYSFRRAVFHEPRRPMHSYDPLRQR